MQIVTKTNIFSYLLILVIINLYIFALLFLDNLRTIIKGKALLIVRSSFMTGSHLVYSKTRNYNHHNMKNEEIFYFDPRICVIGTVNYVQPLVRQFSKRYKTTAFEINGGFVCSNNIEDIRRCNFFIITVSTPGDLKTASETVGKVISGGDIVVYDSTMFPGAMEDNSIPLIEKVSGLECNIQFFACYREHKAGKISKTICGCSPEVCKIIDEIYTSVTTKSIAFDYTSASNVV